jgi:hypothetical protein
MPETKHHHQHKYRMIKQQLAAVENSISAARNSRIA